MEKIRRQPRLDLIVEERLACELELEEVERVLSHVSNILLNGTDLILNRIFDRLGFNRIEDEIFRKLLKARLYLGFGELRMCFCRVSYHIE